MNRLTTRRVCRYPWVLAPLWFFPRGRPGRPLQWRPSARPPGEPPRDSVPPSQRAGTAAIKGRVVDGAGVAPFPAPGCGWWVVPAAPRVRS